MDMFAVRRVYIPIDGSEPAAAPPMETGRVLFVSGDADLCAAGARVLGLEGYEVVTAAHSGHAQLACRAATRPFDILITELSLDDIPGPALAETLRRHQPVLRAVYMAEAGTPTRDGVVVRPFTRDDLLREMGACGAATSTAS